MIVKHPKLHFLEKTNREMICLEVNLIMIRKATVAVQGKDKQKVPPFKPMISTRLSNCESFDRVKF